MEVCCSGWYTDVFVHEATTQLNVSVVTHISVVTHMQAKRPVTMETESVVEEEGDNSTAAEPPGTVIAQSLGWKRLKGYNL